MILVSVTTFRNHFKGDTACNTEELLVQDHAEAYWRKRMANNDNDPHVKVNFIRKW